MNKEINEVRAEIKAVAETMNPHKDIVTNIAIIPRNVHCVNGVVSNTPTQFIITTKRNKRIIIENPDIIIDILDKIANPSSL